MALAFKNYLQEENLNFKRDKKANQEVIGKV
jgi:hypothetical protein